MIKYREHRGSLQESLDTAREFSTLKDCLQYIKGAYNDFPGHNIKNIKDFSIAYYGYDERVHQELYRVYCHSELPFILGFIYEETE
jgi:hypothetical protein